MESIKVLIADDHQLFIAGLKSILADNEEQKCEIVGIAHNGDQVIQMLKEIETDLLILDLNMPEKDGLDVINVIRAQNKELRILALTVYDESKIVKSAFKSGVDGYILKNVGMDELWKAIGEVMEGRTFLGKGVRLNTTIEEIKRKIEDQSRFPSEDKFIKKYNLTKRELEIIKLITHALSNKEIGKVLYISDQTVSVHRKNIMRKLGVSNTAGLIKLAYDNSLV